MAIPSGSSTEVIHRTSVNINDSNAWHYIGSSATSKGFSGASGTTERTVNANMIITVLNIIICNTHDTNNENFTVDLKNNDLGGHVGRIIHDQALPAKSTFVWDDRFTMHPSDYIRIIFDTGAPGSADVIMNYILQDWT